MEQLTAQAHAFALQGIDHVALTVRDVEESVRWYADVLGLKPWEPQPWGDFPAIVGVGTTSLALFPMPDSTDPPSPPRNVPAIRHIAFRADAANFIRAKRTLTERQIAFETQDHGIARSMYVHDPSGHQIEITTYEVETLSREDSRQ